VAYLAKKGAYKKELMLHPPREAATMRLELRLSPLIISLDELINMRHESTPIHPRTFVRGAHAAYNKAAPAPTAEDLELVVELLEDFIHRPIMQVEEAPGNPRETLVEAEITLALDQDGHLLERLRLGVWPSFRNISSKLSRWWDSRALDT